jgi:hypothetical protein
MRSVDDIVYVNKARKVLGFDIAVWNNLEGEGAGVRVATKRHDGYIEQKKNLKCLPVRPTLRRIIIGRAPMAQFRPANISVIGEMGITKTPPRPRVLIPPPLHASHKMVWTQEKRREHVKILSMSRWRRTDLTIGSKVREAGGTDGEERVKSVEVIARVGVVVRDSERANLSAADITRLRDEKIKRFPLSYSCLFVLFFKAVDLH